MKDLYRLVNLIFSISHIKMAAETPAVIYPLYYFDLTFLVDFAFIYSIFISMFSKGLLSQEHCIFDLTFIRNTKLYVTIAPSTKVSYILTDSFLIVSISPLLCVRDCRDNRISSFPYRLHTFFRVIVSVYLKLRD